MTRGETDRAFRVALCRFLPAVSLTVFCAIVATIYLAGNVSAYVTILRLFGIDPYQSPFLDIFGVLSWAQCHQQGIDVIAENPCDPLGRTLDYSPILLATGKLGLHTGMTEVFGLVLDGLFLFWVFFLPAVRGWPEAIALTLGLFSSVVAFALERANLDLAIFVITVIAVNWALRGNIWRIVAYGLVMLGGLVKYYPCAILIVAIRERLVALGLLTLVTIAVALTFAHYEGVDFLRVLAQIENESWYNTAFGAQNLPRGLAALLSPVVTMSATEQILLELAFAVAALAFAVLMATAEGFQDSLELLSERSRVSLLAGCALILACFFAAQNGSYRGIYFLFVLPAVTEMWRAPVSRAARHRFVLAGFAILFLMWAQLFDRAREVVFGYFGVADSTLQISRFAFWFIRETIWWWVVTMLLALILCLVVRSPSGREILNLFLRPAYLFSAPAQGRSPRRAGTAKPPRD